MDIKGVLTGKRSFSTLELFVRYATLCLLALLVVSSAVNVHYGIDNINLMRVFSNDETFAVDILRKNLASNDLNPRGFYNYGYVYHTVTYYFLNLFAFFDYNVDTRLIALSFRIMSLTAYVLLMVFCYIFSTRVLKLAPIMSLLGVLFLSSVQRLYYWAQMIHPDLLQTLLIVVAATIALSRHTLLSALGSAPIAGIAFGTKYSGMFILPFLYLPYSLSVLTEVRETRSAVRDLIPLILGCIGVIALFLAGWLITNPHVVSNFEAFKEDFVYERRHIARGHGRAEPTDPFLWFPMMNTQFTDAGSLVLVAGLASLLYSLLTSYRHKDTLWFFSNHFNRVAIVGLLYVVGVFAYLMAEVNMRRPRFLLPFLPFLTILSFTGLDHLRSSLSAPWRSAIAVGLLILLTPMTFRSIRYAKDFSNKYNHPYVKAAQWLDRNYPLETRILADDFSYVPPKFENVRLVWGMGRNQETINNYQPQLLIMNKKLSGQWAWKQPGTSFSEGKFLRGSFDGADQVLEAYEELFSPSSPWKIAYEDTGIIILENKDFDPSESKKPSTSVKSPTPTPVPTNDPPLATSLSINDSVGTVRLWAGSSYEIEASGYDPDGTIAATQVWVTPWDKAPTQYDKSWTLVGERSGNSWSGTWTVPPTYEGDYLLVTNVVDSDGAICTGNPMNATCPSGYIAYPHSDPVTCCRGHWIKLIVEPSTSLPSKSHTSAHP